MHFRCSCPVSSIRYVLSLSRCRIRCSSNIPARYGHIDASNGCISDSSILNRIHGEPSKPSDCACLRLCLHHHLHSWIPCGSLGSTRLLQYVGLSSNDFAAFHWLLIQWFLMFRSENRARCILCIFLINTCFTGAIGYIILIASRNAALSYFAVFMATWWAHTCQFICFKFTDRML